MEIQPNLDTSDTFSANDARTKLLRAGVKLFSERGLDGVTTREISELAGLNVSLISYYFQGKEGLYRQALLGFAQNIRHRLDHMFVSILSGELNREKFVNLMRSSVDQMVQIHLENPEIQRLLMRELVDGMPHSRDLFDGVFHQLIVLLIEKIAEAQRLNIVRQDVKPAFVMFLFVHSIDGYFMNQRCNTACSRLVYEMPKDREIFSNAISDILLKGVLV